MDIEEQMIGIYAKKSGLGRTEIKALLEAETWMDADEAIEKGFVNSKVEESIPIAASALESKWFARPPKNYFSETKAINIAKEELKNKIRARLEPKK
jgi:ATP-dependent Clp protease, protease subunit